MKKSPMNGCINKRWWMTSLWLCLCVGTLCAQSLPLKPQPIYDQCEALTVGQTPEKFITDKIAALKDKDAKTRAEAVRQLSSACDSRATEPLIALLKNEDVQVRIAAIETLGQLGDREALDFLMEAVNDKNPHVRLALVSTLASYKLFKAKNYVLNGIANPSEADISDENDMRVRCAAVLTLCQLSDVQHSKKGILFIHNWLSSPHEPIRKLAEQTMYELKDTRNFPTEMFAILKREHFYKLRLWAAEWLGKLHIESARDVLTEAAANDTDPRVKQAAAESLKQLSATK